MWSTAPSKTMFSSWKSAEVLFHSLLLILLANSAHCKREKHPPKVTISNGTYVGVHNDHYNVDSFLGIPFAQPPIGGLRLAQPASLNTSFSGTRNATELQPACVQFSTATIDRPISEDCLTLNIYRPSGFENEDLPVLVWIFGGGYIQGSNSDPRYNLTFMVNNSVRANKPIVAIAINYRVNGFGFMGGPILRDQGLANLGLRDQRLAFQWIQENIKNFGGDSSKVTIWGQSAGAGSVGAQLLAFGGRNDSLFRGAITDSGGPLGVQGPSNATQLSTWNHVLNSTGCAGSSDPIICLRGVSLDKFICAVNSSSVSFGPAYDGDFFVTYNSAQVSNGDFLKVPLITGSNTDEGTEFVGSASYIGALPAVPYPDEASFLQVVNSSLINPAFTQNALAVISALYPDIPAIGAPHTYIGRLNSTFGSQYARVASFSGDVKIIAGRRFTAQQWAKHGVPVYSYRFNQWPIGGLPDTTGTTHFTEVPLVMDDEPGNGYIAPWYPAGSEYNGMDANFTAMAHLMSRMWISFVHDLDPNNHGVTHHNGYPISNWKTYASNGSEALDGYGTNLQVSSSLPGLAEQEPDTWRAEAINYLIQHSYALFGA